MQSKKLIDLADMRVGLLLSRWQDDGGTMHRLLSAKHINAYGEITGYETFNGSKVPVDFFTQKGDILLKIAAPNQAFYISNESDLGILVPSYFAIIRNLDPMECLPQYLSVFLNSNAFLQFAERERTCTTVRSLKLSRLQTLEIPLPAPSRQQEIIDFAMLAMIEEKQLKQLLSLKQQYHQTLLNNILGGSRGSK